MARVLILAPDESQSSKEAVNIVCVKAMVRALDGASGIESCHCVKADNLQKTVLDCADVLILGGGEAVKMRDLIKPAVPHIHAWLQDGRRGLVGICAGAVVASADPKRGLQLTQGVRLREDNLCAVAGLEGDVRIEPVSSAISWLFLEGAIYFAYENGPLLQAAGPHTEAWALYSEGFTMDCPSESSSDSDTGKAAKGGWRCSDCSTLNAKGRKKCGCGMKLREQMKQERLQDMLLKRMQGCAAIVGVSQIGSNDSRAVLFGPHPELSSSRRCWSILQRAVLWSCSKEHSQIESPASTRAPRPKAKSRRRPDFETFLQSWTEANASTA